MSVSDERNVDPIDEMLSLVKNDTKLAAWGFKESYRSIIDNRLIYDSEWCRIKFVWGGWDMRGGNTISIYYGRLHASSNDVKMMMDQEECHCWHREELALHFLDGCSPEDAAESINTHRVIKEYRQSNVGQSLGGKRRQPEWLMRMHVATWEEYAPRLFEVFDLRRPELWEQYREFLKEVYDIKGRLPFIQPPMDKVC